MEREKIFSLCDVTVSNLERIANEEAALSELRLFELSDVVTGVRPLLEELRSSGLGVYELLSCLGEVALPKKTGGLDGVMPSFANLLSALAVRSHEGERASFSRLLGEELSLLGVGEADFLPAEPRDDGFTYVKNTFADEAYDVISQDFSDPRVRYSRDFGECARLVSSGEMAYSLLPFEEKGGTRLNTVSELIWRHDIKVNSVTPDFGPDGTADLKYALVSRSFTVPLLSAGDDRYLEIRVSQQSRTDISELLGVAAMLGHTVYRVNTETFRDEGEDAGFFSVVIRDEGLSFTSLLTYLTLFVTEYYPVGIYKNLE